MIIEMIQSLTGVKGTMKFIIPFFLAATLFTGCKDVGFRQIDVSTRSRASLQTARDVMAQLQQGLHGFYEAKHHYPATNELHLYDSIRNYITTEVDPLDLYRNDNGKGYFIAVGGRSERIIYRYPPTIGVGEYTLYWVGPNGVDEEGEGDDLDAWQAADTTKHFQRQRILNLESPHDPDKLLIMRTGADIYRDSVRLLILKNDSVRYSDAWPLSAYFHLRPELTDEERHRMIREELDRILSPASFVHTDSLLYQNWGEWRDVKPHSAEMAEIVHSDELMFNYYAGDRGSRGIAWLPSKKKFVVVWKS